VSLSTLPDLSLSEWAVLALIAERPRHGFAIAKELASNAEIGQIFTVPRPVVYRALARLEQDDLIYPVGTEPGDRGPARTRMAATEMGRAAVDRWLLTPVAHVRDLRTQLLLQFRLLDRLGRDLAPLAVVQLEQLSPIVDALRGQADAAIGFAALLARWRYEWAQAAARLLEGVAAGATPPELE